MKTRANDYSFSELEITIAKEIASGSNSLAQIRKRLAITPNLLSYYLKKLENKRIITIKRTQQLDKKEILNSRKAVFFQYTKHASLFKDLLMQYSHIKWEKILSGLGIDVLFRIATEPNATESISQTTFWRYLRSFTSTGIATCNYGSCQINSRFSLLRQFLVEYQTFIIERIVDLASSKAVVLWHKGFECLIRVPKTEHVCYQGFVKTATSRLGDYGIQLFSDYDFYFYSKSGKPSILEDIILHTLLIERGNIRYTTYSLLLLRQQLNVINKDYLLKRAVWYDLSLQINAMLEFIETKGIRTLVGLPTWAEFESKMKEYETRAIA